MFFDEEKTIVDEALPKFYESKFILNDNDEKIIHEIINREKIPHEFAVQFVLREALDLYYKFFKLSIKD